MNLGSFSLRNLKQRDIAIIFIVLSIIGSVLWYFFMYQPTRENITVLSTQIEDLDRRIRQGEEAVRNLEDLRLKVAELEQDRRNFLAQLPLESEIANLIDQLRFSASESDVLITNFSQGSSNVDIDDVRAIGFTISSLATFLETMTFLGFLEDSISRSRRCPSWSPSHPLNPILLAVMAKGRLALDLRVGAHPSTPSHRSGPASPDRRQSGRHPPPQTSRSRASKS